MSAGTEARRRPTTPRPVRVLVVAALGLGLAGGLTGAALGGVGAASTGSVPEHGRHGVEGVGEEYGHRAGDRNDLVPAPAPARP